MRIKKRKEKRWEGGVQVELKGQQKSRSKLEEKLSCIIKTISIICYIKYSYEYQFPNAASKVIL